uniref:E4 protein n=1 Tax=Human papillomavirus TaxID=10566 RepID=A0A385PPM8_9PAPI|nr:MAG: E4 protein [Human papillomavirus]
MTVQLLSLLPVLQGGPPKPPQPPQQPSQTPSNHRPPDTPRLSRRALEDLKGKSSFLLPRKSLTFEVGEEEKENDLPYQKEEEQSQLNLSDLLYQLLEKWDHDIDRLRDRVYLDFNDFKSKLGIRP